MKNKLLNLIYEKLPTQQKKIEAAFKEFPEMETELEKFLQLYKLFIKDQNITIEMLADAYVEMLEQMFFCRKEFISNGVYYSDDKDKTFDNVYNDERVMTNYMLALALSQFLWKHHYKIFSYYKKLIPSLKDVRNVLEVGSGHGLFLLELLNSQNNFSTIDVVDISKSSIEMTQNILKTIDSKYLSQVNFYNFDINEYKTEQKYDFITMGEVLEHVENPLEILQSLYEILNINGNLFITTCANCPAIDHIYLFNNIDEIRELIAKAGFKIKTELVIPSEDKSEKYLIKNKVDIIYSALLTK